MLFKFLPKEFSFFDLFDKQVDQAVEAASYFNELVLKHKVDESSLEKINSIEHEGDNLAHDIFENLNKTFITPFDREDIHALAKELDNIPDMIDTIIGRLKIYELAPNDKNLAEFASLIYESVSAVSRAVKGLRNIKNSKSIQEACVEINRLENIGDSKRDEVLAKLFKEAAHPIAVIKWKEIYQDAETVLDICEDITHVVEAILVKQA
jgi:predicted phosphate transport protein (TIGR00153 family)